eukprot:2661954-Pyramimonas_sp.AAC.1
MPTQGRVLIWADSDAAIGGWQRAHFFRGDTRRNNRDIWDAKEDALRQRSPGLEDPSELVKLRHISSHLEAEEM